MPSVKALTLPNMASVLTIIEFYDLATGPSLLSLYAPPPPDVPPANTQLMARTRAGPGLFMCCEQVRAAIVAHVVVLNLFPDKLLRLVILNLVQDNASTVACYPETSSG